MKVFQSYLKKIADINHLDIAYAGDNSEGWIFHHAMLFLSKASWWNNLRKTPHEGIDLIFYKENKGKRIQKLNTDTFIPAATDGKIINICNDFIGKSIVVLDNSSGQNKFNIIYVYAHILPVGTMQIGTKLKQGDVIAKIAKTDKKKTTLPPHLHFSVMEIPKGLPAKDLNWKLFSDQGSEINLINPLFV
jgi:murein DD-endopeptidase MepM/ murein hydrolase activator NlpD